MVSVYLCSALTVLLRVQLSVFGGSLFLQQQGGSLFLQQQGRDQVDHMTSTHVQTLPVPSPTVRLVRILQMCRNSVWLLSSTCWEMVSIPVKCKRLAGPWCPPPGLLQLVQRVREATERVLVSYSLKHQLTSEGVGQLLSDVRAVTASAGRRPSPR